MLNNNEIFIEAKEDSDEIKIRDYYRERWEIKRHSWLNNYYPTLDSFDPNPNPSIPYFQTARIKEINSTLEYQM